MDPPRVDPDQPRGRLYLTIAKLSATRLSAWFSIDVAWKLDPVLVGLSGGRLSTTGPPAAALLESMGARSGRPVATPPSTSRWRAGDGHRLKTRIA